MIDVGEPSLVEAEYSSAHCPEWYKKMNWVLHAENGSEQHSSMPVPLVRAICLCLEFLSLSQRLSMTVEV